MALPLSATGALGQDQCRGWAVSCASVEVRADGDELILFAPNLVSSQAATEAEAAQVEGQPAASPGDAGMVTADPETLSCDEERGTRVLDKDERKRCRRAPVGAFFLIALPASLFVLAPDGQGPPVKSPGLPSEPISTPDSGGDDGGNDGSGAGGGGVTDGGSGDGGASGGGGAGTGGNSGGGSTGGATTGGSTGGATGGNTGGGTTGGGSVGGGSTVGGSYPGAGDLPPISQVPEPVSTTLFGIGLASLAGARIRRLRQGAASSEDS